VLTTDQHATHAAIFSIGTAVPAYQIDQAFVGNWVAESFADNPSLARWVRRLYGKLGIETRYTCLPDRDYAPSESRFAPGRGQAHAATTAERMAIYERESVIIGTQAAQRALEACCGPHTGDLEDVTNSITHLITVSCTGFFAPGLDQMLARQLGLKPTVERLVVGFMGCAAAFNALRLAEQIVRGQPSARVLIVCVELCTIHIQPSPKPVDIVGGALFADGAGACIVGMPAPEQRDVFAINGFHTELTPETESFMVWHIGDFGYTLHLSTDIPANLAVVAPLGMQTLLGSQLPQLAFWGIHPGGRAIVDRLAEVFELTDAQVEVSRAVLRNYGNVSSPTIFFVLQGHQECLRQRRATVPLDGVAMAFGPGLVTEMAHLSYLPAEMGCSGEAVLR
jgi:predicted naringenin-chalcone synthase